MKKDKLDNDLKVGDYIGLCNAGGSMLIGQIYGFKKARMHYLRYYENFRTCQSYTTRYTDCVKIHEDLVPNQIKKKLEPEFNDLSRKMERGII